MHRSVRLLFGGKSRELRLDIGDALVDKALEILTSHCFGSYLGNRPAVINKWFHARYKKEQLRLGQPDKKRMILVFIRTQPFDKRFVNSIVWIFIFVSIGSNVAFDGVL